MKKICLIFTLGKEQCKHRRPVKTGIIQEEGMLVHMIEHCGHLKSRLPCRRCEQSLEAEGWCQTPSQAAP